MFDPAARSVGVLPTDGGPRRTLASGIPSLSSVNLQFSPDGRYIYFAVSVEGIAEIWRVSVSEGAPAPTGLRLRFAYTMSLHPDGEQFLIESHWRPQELWIIRNIGEAAK